MCQLQGLKAAELVSVSDSLTEAAAVDWEQQTAAESVLFLKNTQ